DAYYRFNSYVDRDSFANAVIKLVPQKIDIGAVYPMPVGFYQNNLFHQIMLFIFVVCLDKQPINKASYSTFVPKEKELVFDIDISDYDDIRTCCQAKKICEKCWP